VERAQCRKRWHHPSWGWILRREGNSRV